MIQPYSSAIAYLFWDTEMNDRSRRIAVRRQMWMPLKLYLLGLAIVLPAIIYYMTRTGHWNSGVEFMTALRVSVAIGGPVSLLFMFLWRAFDASPARWLQARRADLRHAGHTGGEILSAALEPGMRGALLVSGLHIAMFMLAFVIGPALFKSGEIENVYSFMLIFLAPVVFLWLTATPLDVALWAWTDSWLIRLGALLLLLLTSPMLVLTGLFYMNITEYFPGERIATLILLIGWIVRGAAVWKVWQTAGTQRGN